MLTIEIPERELYDEDKNEFVHIKPTKITLEHSLKSISKWESKWHIRYFDETHKKTAEETIDYIRCMTITQNVDPNVYFYIPEKELIRIKEYIEDPMTATTFSSNQTSGSNSSQQLSAELLYYYMASYGIWLDWEKRHINQLITLLKVCSEKNKTPKQMSKSAIARNYRQLNAARRAKLHSKG